MPDEITNGYCALYELKAALEMEGDKQDGRLRTAIEAASRFIDKHCGQHFYVTESEVRYFTARDFDEVVIDPAVTVTALATDHALDRNYSTVWASGDYETISFKSGPVRRIVITPNGSYTFPLYRNSVKVTGTWGYSATIPTAIRQACLLIAQRIYKRADAIFGVAGAPAVGTQIVQAQLKVDSDVEMLLRGYKRFS